VRVAVADEDAVPGLVATLRPELEARGGSLVVERAMPAVKERVDVWGDPGPGADLMRAVQRAFDPQGIFSPGRFVAGLCRTLRRARDALHLRPLWALSPGAPDVSPARPRG